MNKIFGLVITCLLVGCAATNVQIPTTPNIIGGTYRFDGPGEFNDLLNARYQCAQETMSRSSSSSAVISSNSSSGVGSSSSSSSSLPSCSMFNACLAAKGYIRNSAGRLDASSVPIKCNEN